ncbi:hypothetical protein Dimus_006764 [Dionaea muscipula]
MEGALQLNATFLGASALGKSLKHRKWVTDDTSELMLQRWLASMLIPTARKLQNEL